MTQALPAVRVRTRRQLDAAPAPNDGVQEGSILVTRSRYGSESEEVFKTKIAVPTFPVPPAYIQVKAGETINTGDYNSVRVDVSLSLPCLPEVSELERVKTLASDTVERWLESEIRRARDPNWETPPL